MRGKESEWLAGSATARSWVWLVLASACLGPAHADEPQLLGELRHVDERRADGRITRVSDRQPDGEDIIAGAYLFAEDRLSLTGVIVTVVICSREEKHSAMTVAVQLQIPAGCTGRGPSPEPAAGASYAASDEGPSNPSQHLVVLGDTLFSISRQYELSMQALMTANDLKDPDLLYVGQELLIPGAPVQRVHLASGSPDAATEPAKVSAIEEKVAEGSPPESIWPVDIPFEGPRSVRTVTVRPDGSIVTSEREPSVVTGAAPLSVVTGSAPPSIVTGANPPPPSGQVPERSAAHSVAERDAAEYFTAPATGRITEFFTPGRRNGIRMSISNSVVKSIGDGVVIYSGQNAEFGNLIIVKHDGGLVSVYGNLSSRSVDSSDSVLTGESIGVSGPSGLYFELRKGTMPIDPLPLIGTATWQ